MDVCRLEFPKYQRRIRTFLIGDSFLSSSNVREEMAGDALTQSLPLKRLNVRVVIGVIKCVVLYICLRFLFGFLGGVFVGVVWCFVFKG